MEECCILSAVAEVKDRQCGERREVEVEEGLVPTPVFLTLPAGVLVPDSQEAGQQELCSQESGSSGDTGFHISDLL